MKERPILFSAAMVKAIQNGRKTQTRRVIKDPSRFGCLTGDCPHEKQAECDVATTEWARTEHPYVNKLWVRETFYIDRFDYIDKPLADLPPLEDKRDPYYRADGDCCAQIPECECGEVGKPKWRPSIFMPRWASRITLEVLNVRVERLQDISEDDAKAEGVEASKLVEMKGGSPCYSMPYQILWNQINGVGSWDANPWVFVIDFKPAREVIDGAIAELRKAIL